MKYSIQDIYYQFGQLDKVAGVNFCIGSTAYQKYGHQVIGEFIYSQSERLSLDAQVQGEDYKRTDGIVRLKVYDSKTTEEVEELLRLEGFLASDIINIYSLSSRSIYGFTNSDIKELPKPTIININIPSSGNADLMTLNLNYYRLEGGISLHLGRLMNITH